MIDPLCVCQAAPRQHLTPGTLSAVPRSCTERRTAQTRLKAAHDDSCHSLSETPRQSQTTSLPHYESLAVSSSSGESQAVIPCPSVEPTQGRDRTSVTDHQAPSIMQHLRQRGLRLLQPERHLHDTVQCDGRGEFCVGLLPATCRSM